MKCPSCKEGWFTLPSGRVVQCTVCNGSAHIHENASNSVIVLHLPRARKGAYVKQAVREKQTLAGWIFKLLDEASGFKSNPPEPDPRTERTPL